MAKTNKFNVPNGLMNQGKVADIPEFPFFFHHSSKFIKKISRKRSFCVSNNEQIFNYVISKDVKNL